MDALTALQTRVSIPLVTEPGPDEQQLEHILLAALRAADHGRLSPWRFLSISGDDRIVLGQLFVAASLMDDACLDEATTASIHAKALRAPLVLVAIASPVRDPGVPELEQIISAGAAVQNILNACHALGLGAMWRTGTMAYHPKVRQGLGLTGREQVVGFIYIGQPRGLAKQLPQRVVGDFMRRWSGT